MPKRIHKQPATNKAHATSKQQHSGPMVDGIGGAGGASGAGGVETKLTKIGELSGIDPHLRADEVPTPGSTGRDESGHSQASHNASGLPGKTRGPDTETAPHRDDDGG